MVTLHNLALYCTVGRVKIHAGPHVDTYGALIFSFHTVSWPIDIEKKNNKKK